MNYATTVRRPNPLAALGAMGVPAGFGFILIAGLAVNIVVTPPLPNPQGTQVKPDVVVPIEPVETDLPPTSDTKSSSQQTEQTLVRPPSDYDFELGPTGPIGALDEFDTGSLLGSEGLGTGLPPLPPLFEAVEASPLGNPANWITTADYRSSWIRREYTGTARFTLQVDISGRVSNCSITGSTGYRALDEATCVLLQRRARFTPARGTEGQAVPGIYSNSVNWTIPE
jgi:periplasmic protein TonB